MKKYFLLTCFALAISISSAIVAMAGYWCGPGEKYYITATTGKDLLTHWVEASMLGHGDKRRLTVYNGNNHKTSKWYDPNDESTITVKVTSSYFNNDAKIVPEFAAS